MKLLFVALTLIFVSAASSPVFAQDPAQGEIVAEPPRIMDPDQPEYFQFGAGPGFGLNLDSDKALFNANVAYNRNFSERITGKVIGDFNIGTADEVARFLNFALGTDIYLREVSGDYGTPYAALDLGYAFVRDGDSQTKDGAAIGGGLGFKFALAQINMDLNLHYTLLTAQIDGDNPSVFATRLAFTF